MDESSGDFDEVFKPQWLEVHVRPQDPQFIRGRVVDKVVRGHDRHSCPPLLGVRSEPTEKREAVHERHPQIDQHNVGLGGFHLTQRGLGIERRRDLVAFQPQHASERFDDTGVVVDNEDFGR